MATKLQVEANTSPASSAMIPLNSRRSRRGSVVSVSSVSQADKETLSHVLDQIHTAASQSTTLTTFNQFTTPPSSSSGVEGKGIAGELQGGISGLYNRFKASVGSSIEGTVLVTAVGEGGLDDAASPKSSNTLVLSKTTSSKRTSREARHQSPSASVLVTKPSGEQVEEIQDHPFTVPYSTRDAPLQNSVADASMVPSIISKPLIPNNGAAKGSLLLVQAAVSRVAGPAIAEVYMNNFDVHKKDVSQNRDKTTSEIARKGKAHSGIGGSSEQMLGQPKNADDHNQRPTVELSEVLFAKNPDHLKSQEHTPHGSGDLEKAPLERVAISRKTTRVSELRGDIRQTTSRPESSDDGSISPKQTPMQDPSTSFDGTIDTQELLTEPDLTPTFSLDPPRDSMPAQEERNIPQDTSMSPKLQQLRGISGFTFSRTSSTDTAGASSTNTAIYNKSQGEEVSDRLTANRTIPLKAVATTQTFDQPPQGTDAVLSQTRSKVLSKEYWMRDENAKDCFYCGDSFSTFRRKHHCRTCGQIFDAKCTSLVSGKQFGQSGTLRVCKPCENLINGNDDSSDFTDDESLLKSRMRPRHGSRSASDVSPSRALAASKSRSLESEARPTILRDVIPTLGIPATRRVGDDTNRRSAILEIGTERRLARPGSSRSLKSSSLGTKSNTSSHKRHHSRHLLQRGFKTVSEETAPFQRNPNEDSKHPKKLPAFHTDNIIDPDLAAFLSDDESSGEEQVSIMSALNGDGMSRSGEHDRNALSGFLASTKKTRSRIGDKTATSTFLVDDSTYKLKGTPRMLKHRNLSISSNIHLRRSPRFQRFSTASPAMSTYLHESSSYTALDHLNSPSGGSRMIRSSSMRGLDAPAIELNNASIQHVRKLLRQLLQDMKVTNASSWEKALIPILLQATDDVNPNVQNGDDIDIRHYVKLKKIPGGRPGDTSYVSGLVFTKNLALKSMPRSIGHPNILILTFPLEYARHQQHFMSLEPVIRQEREYLQNLVHRIAALEPQLLLVQRNISGLALEFLEQAHIATAYNVKASVLEAISRCCQTRIISSVDKLAIKSGQAGKCASFHLKTYVRNGRKKTYMYLSGCPKDLGCTIVLRGGDETTLAKIKCITEFMVYVVYNLKLETCLMRDEFALIPSYTGEGSISPDKETGKNSRCLPQSGQEQTNGKAQKVESRAGHSDITNPEPMTAHEGAFSQKQKEDSDETEDIRLPDDIPMPTFYGDMIEKHKTKILSASPFVKFMQPHLLMKAREQERKLRYLKRLRDQDFKEEQNVEDMDKPQKFMLIKPEMIHENLENISQKIREVLHAAHDAEYDKALHTYRTQKKQWEAYLSGSINLFDPFSHQNIAVLYSVICTVTTIPCSGPDLLALGFYNEHETDADFEADCTLGQYVEDLCLGANTVCTANGCERKMHEHHRQYVHGNGQLVVIAQHHPCELRGLQDSILMWSTCRVCGKNTQVMPMSDSTWKYSFGKYLELSFWSTELHPRAGVCPHDLHRDHIRYFGFKDIALRVQYDPIDILEIVVPRTRITWKVANDLRFKNDVYSKAEEKLNKFMLSVKTRIKSIRIDSVIPEKADSCVEEVDRLWKCASDDHLALLRQLQDRYMGSKYFEIIPFNQAIRATQEKVAEWDDMFADFDHNFFPSERDIRRLATLQLKKIFLDRDESVTSLTSTDEDTNTPPIAEEEWTEKKSSDEAVALNPQTRNMSSGMANEMLSSVAWHDSPSASAVDCYKSAPPTSIPALEPLSDQFTLLQPDLQGVRHLDLALPTEATEGASGLTQLGSRPVSPTSTRPNTDARNYLSIPPLLEPSIIVMEKRPPLKHTVSSSSVQPSSIPRATEAGLRHVGKLVPPVLHRFQSQPAQSKRKTSDSNTSIAISTVSHDKISDHPTNAAGEHRAVSVIDHAEKKNDTKLSERLGLSALKASRHSLIPRSIASRRKESKVSTLAKHFEQLSREFERERLRERRQRVAKSKQARNFPMKASKPIVEVYRNVRDAVEEREPSDEDSLYFDASPEDSFTPETHTPSTAEVMAQSVEEQTSNKTSHAGEDGGEDTAAEDTAAEYTETDDNTHIGSYEGSDAEGETVKSDEEQSLVDDMQSIPEPDDVLSRSEAQLRLKLGLPKHEKSSLMKMLTNFWAERSASGWLPLEYPLGASDHIFADSDIIIREDEPSSLIAFALGSEDYKAKLRNIQEKSKDSKIMHEKSYVQDPMLSTEKQKRIECSLLQSTGIHLKYQFREGSARMLCKVFYAEQFDAVRQRCGVNDRIVESLSRCMKWDSKGGKTKSVFLKTLDDRLVLKSLSQIETQAFLRFAPAYFQLMSEALFHELPSVIAKMLGFYQIVIKNPITGVEFNWFLLIMENLFYDHSPTRIFDLKGSMRNRRIQSTGEQNEVLLDENMVEFIADSPLFVREHSKKLLRASVWNDTLFLSRQNVMDYSLMIAIDEDRKELVVGIIDCIRTYTWDKKLESWIKDRGKNRPTVTSPKEYKSRFREAMGRYVLHAPNCWHQFQAPHYELQPSKYHERLEDLEGEPVEAETELAMAEG